MSRMGGKLQSAAGLQAAAPVGRGGVMKAALVTLKTTEAFNQSFGRLQKACKRQGSTRCLQQPGMVQQLRFRISKIQMIRI